MINFQIGCYKTNDPVLCEDGTVSVPEYDRYISITTPWNMASHGLSEEEAIARLVSRVVNRAKRERIDPETIKFFLMNEDDARSVGIAALNKWISKKDNILNSGE